jgi:1-acyl-sn-glycerol-3-phosphate acyltransferase
MGKGNVLGNDPFERGAAARDAIADVAAESGAKPEVVRPKARKATKGAKRSKTSTRRSASKPTAARPMPPLHVVDETGVRGRGPGVRSKDAGREGPTVETEFHRDQPPPPPSALSDLALKIAGRALAMPAIQRAVQILGSSPTVGRIAQAAVKATGFVWRSPIAGAARALLPAAQSAANAALSPKAASSIVATALSAADAARRIVATRTGPSDVDEFGEDPSAVERMNPVLDFLYERYWRVQVEGFENIPDGPSIVICNHSGALPFDGPMMRTALRREAKRPEARWLVEDAIAHAPFMGVYLNRLGAVRACPENAERLLEKKAPVIVFPEGVHGIGRINVGFLGGRRYQVGRFGRGGFVKLALRTRAPIIPVAIFGAEDSLPLLAKIPAKGLGVPYIPVTPTFLFPLPMQWKVRVLAPIDLNQHPASAENDQALVQSLAEDVRQRVQSALDDLVAARSA